MAEPVSSLPVPPQTNEPIPWPETARPTPDLQGPVRLLPENASSVDAENQWDRVQHTASEMLARATRRLRQLRRERPVEIILAVAVASFALGCALRIWRSHHE
jgi:hypothetical protein